MPREFSYVVFGASGYTGLYVVECLAKYLQTKPQVTWAVAGRNANKIAKFMEQASKNTGIDLGHIPVIIADVGDEPSLMSMARRAEIIIDVVGPYRLYGEPVVKACAENGCSFVDITGEMSFVESMQEKYNDVARKNNCYIVSTCGFESIPTEMFTHHLLVNNPDVRSVEIITEMKPGPYGYTLNHGTYDSLLMEMENFEAHPPIHKRIMPQKMPAPDKLVKRWPLFKTADLAPGLNGKWALMSPDTSVNTRTQYYQYVNENKQPIQFNTYIMLGSLFRSVVVLVGLMCGFILAKIPFIARFMHQHPRLFTLGMFTFQGPTRKQADTTTATIWVVGHKQKDDRPVVLRVDTPDLAYNATAIFIVSSALAIVEDRNKLPQVGGVYTPGIAFRNTNILDKLNNFGVQIKHVQ